MTITIPTDIVCALLLGVVMSVMYLHVGWWGVALLPAYLLGGFSYQRFKQEHA